MPQHQRKDGSSIYGDGDVPPSLYSSHMDPLSFDDEEFVYEYGPQPTTQEIKGMSK
jgi:hypothetical protein